MFEMNFVIDPVETIFYVTVQAPAMGLSYHRGISSACCVPAHVSVSISKISLNIDK